MNEIIYIFVVDGGGTKTRAKLFDTNGNYYTEAIGGASNINLGLDNAYSIISGLFLSCCKEAGLDIQNNQFILVLGLAGYTGLSRSNLLTQRFSEYGECHILNDSTLAMLGAHQGKAGMSVTAGTGSSISARMHDGTIIEAGGFGFPAGDQGSGAWLGFCAFRDFLYEMGNLPLPIAFPDKLKSKFISNLGDSRADWIKFNTQAKPKDFAQFAITIFDLAKDGDEYCTALLNEAVKHLTYLIGSLQDENNPLPITLNGSVANALAEKFVEFSPHWQFTQPVGDSVSGGVVYANEMLMLKQEHK